MFCNKCGAEVPEGSSFCPKCGNALSGSARVESTVNDVADMARDTFNNAERSFGSAINDVRKEFNGQGYTAGQPLKTDRNLLAYILLSIITCGIYGYYFLYTMARDVNVACDGDGETTGGLVAYILLSIITCGIYSIYWYYKLGNRLATNANRYDLSFQENGTTVLLWLIFGSLLCGVGYFIASNILIKNTNAICDAYNRAHGL